MKALILIASAALTVAAPALADGHATKALNTAVAGDQRSESNRARDAYRHPVETLTFFGFEPGQTVIEIWPGGGWYTEILAPAMKNDGELVLAVYGEGEGTGDYHKRNHREFMAKLEADPEVFGDASLVEFWPPRATGLGESGSADLVVTFRNMHSMLRRDQADAFFPAAFDVLKPGGVLGIVQHRAPEGADAAAMAPKGYVPTAWVVAQAEAAGFVLEESSEINANPRDTKDYTEGVWTLPPALRAKDGRDDVYRAIGESDRMTLRFRRP